MIMEQIMAAREASNTNLPRFKQLEHESTATKYGTQWENQGIRNRTFLPKHANQSGKMSNGRKDDKR